MTQIKLSYSNTSWQGSQTPEVYAHFHKRRQQKEGKTNEQMGPNEYKDGRIKPNQLNN